MYGYNSVSSMRLTGGAISVLTALTLFNTGGPASARPLDTGPADVTHGYQCQPYNDKKHLNYYMGACIRVEGSTIYGIADVKGQIPDRAIIRICRLRDSQNGRVKCVNENKAKKDQVGTKICASGLEPGYYNVAFVASASPTVEIKQGAKAVPCK